MAADWSLLPSDLIRRVGDCLLASEDFDCYGNLRLVCCKWRSGTANPKMADFDDTCFLPKKLAMVDLDVTRSEDAAAVATFVNLDTGRFLRKRVPWLRDYYFVAATAGGLVVLSELAPPHETRVLNPFTGNVARFRAPIHAEEVREVAVTTSPLMVFTSWFHGRCVRWADQDSEGFHEVMVYFPDHFLNLTLVSGEVYVTNHGSIVSTVLADADEEGAQAVQKRRTAGTITMTATIPAPPPVAELDAFSHHIVESAGELLLVSVPWRRHVVHKVDTVNKVLLTVTSLGNRSLFISQIRSFSVDADKFPTVEAGCIYFVEPNLATYEYFHLADRRQEESLPMVNLRNAEEEGCILPFTLEQVMVNYCVDTENSSELSIALDTDDEEFFLPEGYGSN
ncbi:hypothetical protein E2562_028064 [Oryza meyeriana var. granulata]|uniref:KIB1-4 beta-propeller domain-containing protein n=1 Tax=Oryza meyeriana var. granulata TaxID=110450 RepID=A0A6G1C120_9ORYZ|nr:hypothetical protein E2562_028064 [Oryza meyeriana var. granulata]